MIKNPLYAILGLAVLGYGAYAAYQWTQGDEGQVVKSTAKRTGSPVSKLTTETGKPRAAKALKLSRKDDVGTEVEEKDLVKQSKPVAELDAKFMVCELGLRATGLTPEDLRGDIAFAEGSAVSFLADASATGAILYI